MSLATIRDGLKTRLATITALANRSHDVWPDQVTAPCAIVKPIQMEFYDAMQAATNRLSLEVILLAADFDVSYARGQDAIDAYLDASGASSILAAIDADPTLGGAADSTWVQRWREYGEIEINGKRFWGVIIDVEVLV